MSLLIATAHSLLFAHSYLTHSYTSLIHHTSLIHISLTVASLGSATARLHRPRVPSRCQAPSTLSESDVRRRQCQAHVWQPHELGHTGNDDDDDEYDGDDGDDEYNDVEDRL